MVLPVVTTLSTNQTGIRCSGPQHRWKPCCFTVRPSKPCLRRTHDDSTGCVLRIPMIILAAGLSCLMAWHIARFASVLPDDDGIGMSQHGSRSNNSAIKGAANPIASGVGILR